MTKDVVVLDYGSGNVRSAVRALERVGATVTLTADPVAALECDGLFVPGVGNFHACMAGLAAAQGPRIIDRRLSGGRPVLGVCVGMQVLFDGSTEPSADARSTGWGSGPAPSSGCPPTSCRTWAGRRSRCAAGSDLFRGVEHERFYFVHSYAVQHWTLQPSGAFVRVAPRVTWARHGAPFVAAVENGPLAATQFHPEKSGDAGATLLENWVRGL